MQSPLTPEQVIREIAKLRARMQARRILRLVSAKPWRQA